MAGRRRKKLSREPIELSIEKLSHEAKGVAYFQDKTVFVSAALPGERVQVELTAKRKGILEAKTLQVLEASEDRVEPPCEFYQNCGGCSLQHLNHQRQIEIKQQILIDHFKYQAKLEIPRLLPVIKSPALGYRTKARLGVRYVAKKGKVLIGFREKHSNFLCDMDSCLVLHPVIGLGLKKLALLIEQLSIKTEIPQIEVSIGEQNAVLIIRHLKDFSADDINSLIDYAKQSGFYLMLQSGGPETVKSLYPLLDENKQKQILFYSLPEFAIKNYFSATDFTQVNRIINRQMITHALSILDPQPEDKILDLFCGMGNFSLPLARLSAEVCGVEGSSELVIKAKANARFNQLDNVSFYCADLFKLDGDSDFRKQQWASQHYHKILLDPARSGAKEIVENIELFKADRIVYVSCNPATLARDAAILVHEKKYQLISAGVMDMFPHTSHVESIALFSK